MSIHHKPVALVTGANKGIGFQIAKDLVGHGFTVLIGSRDFGNGEAAATGIGPDAVALQLDVTNQASINAAAERIRSEFGRLDVLVNNAGISHAGKPGTALDEIVQSGFVSTASLDDVRTVLAPLIEAGMVRHLPPHLRQVELLAALHGPGAGLIGAAFAGAMGPAWRTGHG